VVLKSPQRPGQQITQERPNQHNELTFKLDCLGCVVVGRGGSFVEVSRPLGPSSRTSLMSLTIVFEMAGY